MELVDHDEIGIGEDSYSEGYDNDSTKQVQQMMMGAIEMILRFKTNDAENWGYTASSQICFTLILYLLIPCNFV